MVSSSEFRVAFMVIGAHKSGTTSLAVHLANHPRISFCKNKEPRYFDIIGDWEKHLEEYHSLFSPEPSQICGEGSTYYTFFPETRGTYDRLFAYNPDLKLVYIMRDPVERVVSHYTHHLTDGQAKGGPETEVLSNLTYVNRSRYGVQIQPYLDLFGRENVLLLVFEEYIAAPIETLRKVARFLDVDPEGFGKTAAVHANPSVGKRVMTRFERRIRDLGIDNVVKPMLPRFARRRILEISGRRLARKPEFGPELRETLWRLLESDVCLIEDLLGRRLDVWRSGRMTIRTRSAGPPKSLALSMGAIEGRRPCSAPEVDRGGVLSGRRAD